MIMNFWIASILLILAAVALAIMPLLIRQRQASNTSAHNTNIAQFREQLGELEKQLSEGLISEQERDSLKIGLEKNLLVDVVPEEKETAGYDVRPNRGMALALLILIPLLAVPLYWHLGAQTELSVTELMNSAELTGDELLDILENWQERQPENPQALYLLGDRYLVAGRMDEAVKVFQAFYRVSNSSQGAALLAQALFLQANSQFSPEIGRLVQEALLKDEFNTTALGMQGIAAFEQQDYAMAISSWEKALSVETDPASRLSLSSGIARARSLSGVESPGIRVQVELSPGLSLPGETRVMVYARASGGSRAPLAIKPVLVSELPREVFLDDSAAMIPGGDRLMEVGRLDVVAMISLSGDVTQADYTAEVKSVDPDSRQVVQLLIRPAG